MILLISEFITLEKEQARFNFSDFNIEIANGLYVIVNIIETGDMWRSFRPTTLPTLPFRPNFFKILYGRNRYHSGQKNVSFPALIIYILNE